MPLKELAGGGMERNREHAAAPQPLYQSEFTGEVCSILARRRARAEPLRAVDLVEKR